MKFIFLNSTNSAKDFSICCVILFLIFSIKPVKCLGQDRNTEILSIIAKSNSIKEIGINEGITNEAGIQLKKGEAIIIDDLNVVRDSSNSFYGVFFYLESSVNKENCEFELNISNRGWQKVKEDIHANSEENKFVSTLYNFEEGSEKIGIRLLAKEALTIHKLEVYFNLHEVKSTSDGTQLQGENQEIERKTNEDIENENRILSACSCPLPEFITRAQYGIPNNGAATCSFTSSAPITHLIIHHQGAGGQTSSNWAQRAYNLWWGHVLDPTQTEPYCDVAYNWLLAPDGTLYEGRSGSATNNVRGAHMCGQHDNKLGVCIMGDWTTGTPPAACFETLYELLAWKACEFDIDPYGSGLTGSYTGIMNNISGHKDGCSPSHTTCPGNIYNSLSTIRSGVLSKMNSCSGGPTLANDNPCDSRVPTLTVGSTCSFTQGTNVGATNSAITNVNCDGFSYGDVWFKFIVPASGRVIINTSSGTIDDMGMAIYSGSNCNSLSYYGCYPNGSTSSPNMPFANLNGLTPGATMWIRMWEFNNNNFGTFNICVYNPDISVCADNYEQNNTFQSAYNLGAQSVSLSSLCLTSGDIDWFKFTGVNGSTYYVKVNGVNNAQGPYGLNIQGSSTQIILETVPASGQSIDTYLSLYDANQTLLKIDDNGGAGSLSKITYNFPTSSTPSNDQCNGAIDLVSSTSYNYLQGTVNGATTDGVAQPYCDYASNSAQKGVWYKFIAQSSSHQVNVVPNSSNSNGMDVVIALYSGSNCYYLSERSCQDTPGGNGVSTTLNASNLTVGSVYWVLLYDYGNTPPVDPKFNICITHGSTSNPSNLQLNYPATQTIVNIPVTFSWSATNATSYQLQILNGSDLDTFDGANGLNGPNCTDCLVNTTVYGTNFTWSGAEPGNNAYVWAVRALSASGSTQFQAKTFGTSNPSSAPDILISKIWTEPEKIYTNTDIDLYMSMKNVGNSTASSIDINYYLDGVLIDDDYHSSLTSGSTREEYENNYVFTSPGIYEYCVGVEQVSGESNLSNNYTCINLEVIQAYGDVFVSNAQLAQSVVFQGQQISMSVTQNYFGNQLDSELPSFDMAYYLSTDCDISSDDILIGTDLSSLGSDDVSSSESNVYQLSSTIQPGQYYVIIDSDSNNELVETDEDNNKVCLPIEIKKLSTCNSSDFAFLKEIYTKTNGDNWLNNNGWDIIRNNSSPPVGCSFDNLYGINSIELYEVSRVSEVFLQNNNLTGILPTANSNLSALITLDLSSNNITGVINTSFGTFPQLWQLNLGQNQLTGTFPPALLDNTNLSYLNVSKNSLNGTLPSTISNLNNLVFLYLHGNNFSGKLPKELGDLSNVEYMGIRDNAFSDCYHANLNKLCPKISNTYLMDNNGNAASWVNFCLNNSGICVSCLETLGHSSKAFDFNSGTNDFETNSISGTVNLTNKITGSAKASYKAGKYILLEPSFKVDSGAVFSAENGGCETD